VKLPSSKNIKLHPDAEAIYKKEIVPIDQLRSIFDGLKWLISHDYETGTIITKNYYNIKSSEKLPVWHRQKFDIDKLPAITILYSVGEDEIVIEGININR
jgi:hypothetical protein